MSASPVMTLDADGNYLPWSQPHYGYGANGKPVAPEIGYELVPWNTPIEAGDKPYDVYSGWINGDGYHARIGAYADSGGRWTAWERPK